MSEFAVFLLARIEEDKAAALAEYEAKRRLIGLEEKDSYWVDVLSLLALPYTHHKDFREEWRP